MKTKKEIIEETANFYTLDNRGYDSRDGSLGKYSMVCSYHDSETGNKCAVGRCMTEDGLENYGQFRGDINQLAKKLSLDHLSLDDFLKEEYRGHDVGFWGMLQKFHDSANNWNDEGLTKHGQEWKEYLMNIYTYED